MHLIYSRLTAKGEEVKGKKQKTPDARAREKIEEICPLVRHSGCRVLTDGTSDEVHHSGFGCLPEKSEHSKKESATGSRTRDGHNHECDGRMEHDSKRRRGEPDYKARPPFGRHSTSNDKTRYAGSPLSLTGASKQQKNAAIETIAAF